MTGFGGDGGERNIKGAFIGILNVLNIFIYCIHHKKPIFSKRIRRVQNG